jgi:thiamine pyrophosphate-dependent acetolactate synthase large subunit-like protein
MVIDIQSDGDALYTPSALWTAAHYELPLLIVMDNNRAYNNSMEHAARIARARQRPVENQHIGTEIADPYVDFAKMAQAYGIYAEGPIIDPADLKPALDAAARVVREQRRPALVDVVTSRNWWAKAGP